MSNYICKLKLSEYINSRVVDLENADGVLERGIFIPAEINDLFISPRNQVISWLFINEKRNYTGDDYTHYIKPKYPLSLLKKIGELGFKIPFIGSLKKSKIYTKKGLEFKNNDRILKNISI